MQVLFDGPFWVDNCQFQLFPVDADGDVDVLPELYELESAFAGQSNGLVGAAYPGGLALVTALRIGEIALTVQLHDAAPPLAADWQEIVEVSLHAAGLSVLTDVQFATPVDVPLEASWYRVRYHTTYTDAVDRSLLQFWPAEPIPDQVVRETGNHAAHCHSRAHALSLP